MLLGLSVPPCPIKGNKIVPCPGGWLGGVKNESTGSPYESPRGSVALQNWSLRCWEHSHPVSPGWAPFLTCAIEVWTPPLPDGVMRGHFLRELSSSVQSPGGVLFPGMSSGMKRKTWEPGIRCSDPGAHSPQAMWGGQEPQGPGHGGGEDRSTGKTDPWVCCVAVV